jgi:RHS repeat-associated protein
VAIDGTNVGVAYDKNGNMLRVPTGDGLEGPPRHLKWNAWNQMVEVRDDGDASIQRNVYDALFRRTTRELADATVIHCYYNDQWRPVEERVGGSTNPGAVYYWGARHRDDLARRDRDANGDGTLNESLWCLMDYFDPVAVVDADGAVVERYAFTAFGVASILAPDYSARTVSSVAWDFLFHGQFEDGETGWQNYGFRYFDPLLGNWFSRDPIEISGGANLYAGAKNNFSNRNDFLGLCEADYDCCPTGPNGSDVDTADGTPCCTQEDVDKILQEKQSIIDESNDWNKTSPRYKLKTNECYEQAQSLKDHLKTKGYKFWLPRGTAQRSQAGDWLRNPILADRHNVVSIAPRKRALECNCEDFTIDPMKWPGEGSGPKKCKVESQEDFFKGYRHTEIWP